MVTKTKNMSAVALIRELSGLLEHFDAPIKTGNKWLDLWITLIITSFNNEADANIFEGRWQKHLESLGIKRGDRDFTKEHFENITGVVVSPMLDRVKKTLKSNFKNTNTIEFWEKQYIPVLTELVNMTKQLYYCLVMDDDKFGLRTCGRCNTNVTDTQGDYCPKCGYKWNF